MDKLRNDALAEFDGIYSKYSNYIFYSYTESQYFSTPQGLGNLDETKWHTSPVTKRSKQEVELITSS